MICACKSTVAKICSTSLEKSRQTLALLADAKTASFPTPGQRALLAGGETEPERTTTMLTGTVVCAAAAGESEKDATNRFSATGNTTTMRTGEITGATTALEWYKTFSSKFSKKCSASFRDLQLHAPPHRLKKNSVGGCVQQVACYLHNP